MTCRTAMMMGCMRMDVSMGMMMCAQDRPTLS
jgi:hypothetical protein